MTYQIEHDPSKGVFYIKDSDKISRLSYEKINDNTLNYYSTYVPDELRGKGIAAILTRFALDYAKENNFKIKPSCSYVRIFIERHPEYNSLL